MTTDDQREKQRLRNMRMIEARRADPEVRAAWATYMHEYRAKNLERERKRDRDRYARDPQRRHNMKKSKFGITYDEYMAISESQNHRCAICGNGQHPNLRARRLLDIDHDHKTGKIRALLCSACNRGMGLLRDDPDLMQKAIKYLRAHGT